MEDKSSVLLQTRGFGKILLLGKALSHFVAYHLHTLLLTIAFKIFFLSKTLAPQMRYELKPPKESLEGPKSLILVLGGALRMQRRGAHRELCNEV